MAEASRPPRTVRIALLAALLSAPLACKPDAKSALVTPPEPPAVTNQRVNDPQTAAQLEEAARESDPVEPNHVVFIATPRPYQLLDCATFDTPAAPHRQPAQQMHDATDFPERFGVPLDVVEILQNPLGPAVYSLGHARPDDPKIKKAYVAFALGRGAFRVEDHKIHPKVYNARYCKKLNEMISAKFLVVHAYPVYVDHGNGLDQPWGDLGTDAGKSNAGFDMLEAAQAHAATLMKRKP